MNSFDQWEKALRRTEIIRPRVTSLETFDATKLPYLFLSESVVNIGDTVTRSGEVKVQKPTLILPGFSPQFEGFDFDRAHVDPNMITNMLLVRGITMPSLRYSNNSGAVGVYEGRLPGAKEHYLRNLQMKEDVVTTLLSGPEDCWQMSLLIFVAGQVARSAEGDVQKIFERFKKRKWF